MIRKAILASVLLGGCANSDGAHDLVKAIEGGAYDTAAEIVSGYCEKVHDKGLWVQRTRVEARREIRQSDEGLYGPPPPNETIAGLDQKTALAKGPILRIWCEGEEVPAVIWADLVRDWRD